MNRTLKIKFTFLNDYTKSCNIPDLYSGYGRFGFDYNGNYFFSSTAESQHPGNTKLGYYWALNKEMDTLFISYRSRVGDLDFLDNEIINYLIEKLGLKSRFNKFFIEN